MTRETVITFLSTRAKPPGSLGRLEELATQLCVAQQTLTPRTSPRRLVLFAADHGVVAEGVSAWPADATQRMTRTIANGQAASSVLAAVTGTELRLIDVGTLQPDATVVPGCLDRRVRQGTRNLAVEPALTVAEFRQARAVGEDQAEHALRDGMAVVAAGELGVGNSTPASCLVTLLTGSAPEQTVGAGSGAMGAVLEKKRQVVRNAVLQARQRFDADPETAIASVCGLEIAAMAGFYRAAAATGLTVILDGYIATAAALVAEHLWPGTGHALIAAHLSAEPGHRIALDHLGLMPFLDNWEMRLGEGTGTLVLMPMLDAAAAMMRMASLQDLLASPS